MTPAALAQQRYSLKTFLPIRSPRIIHEGNKFGLSSCLLLAAVAVAVKGRGLWFCHPTTEAYRPAIFSFQAERPASKPPALAPIWPGAGGAGDDRRPSAVTLRPMS
ncbi:hypothetical protein EVAR_6229_1 [Eumeta japonica]|uniref:Uncharacterized protein n=1 Tax=Eumeta variegata TaxID=151549 RepID=A0A4C1T821_EUMVA|nr:hypothetical protein EVAR_6229_1 [Eumeta japonica]